MNGKLTVLTGKQQGAVAWLMPGATLTLGSSLEDDVVLRDPTIERRHAVLQLEDNQITLSSEAGLCLSNGESIELGTSRVIDNNALFQLGDVGLAISCETSSQDASALDAAHKSAHSDVGDEAGDEDGHEALQSATNAQGVFSSPQADDMYALSTATETAGEDAQSATAAGGWVSYALVASVFLLCIAIAWQSGFIGQQSDEHNVDLQAELAELPLAGVSIEQSGSSAIVSGFVDTAQESRQLDRWLKQTGFQITNNVSVGEALGDKVFDVFRVNGIAADVQVSDGTNVTVATSEAQLDRLDAVEARVKEDIPGIATLTINNEPPEITEPDIPVAVDPGKRVAMVVSDEPAFIVTVDESRYFVGSLLPTGHRIEAIKDGVVSLEKNGVNTTLEF